MLPSQKLAAAMARVYNPINGLAPYFGVALRMLVRRESTTVPTLAVSNDGILSWNAEFVEKTPVETLAFGLMHEIQHIVLQLFERAAAMGVVYGKAIGPELAIKATLANLAHDACVNENLRKINPNLPKEWVYPETLDQPEGLIFEDRFRRLLDELREQQEQQEQQGQGQQVQGQGNPQGQGAPGQGSGSRKGKGGGKGADRVKSDGGVGQGNCGTCSGKNEHGHGGAEGNDDGDGRSQAEVDRARRETAAAIQAHVAEKGRGTVPDGLVRWADDYLEPPKVDWRTKLQNTVRDSIASRPGAIDLNWRGMSRRQSGLGYGAGAPIVPSLHAPVPRVGIIFDTSGSMGQDDLAAGARETAGVLDSVGAEVTFAVCDAAMHGIAEVASIEEALALLKGGGGTDMNPAFKAYEERDPRPEVVIVFTDGMIGDGHPASEPDWCRVIWVLVGASATKPCGWGEQIFITETGAQEAA